MKQLSGQDAMFLYMDEPNAGTHGTILFIYDPSTAAQQPVRFKTILAHIQERLSVSPLFRRKLLRVPFAFDYPYWIDDPNFEIEYHVRHIALPKPGDWRQLCILASRLHEPPLDLSRPPWEMFVIEGLDNIDWIPKGSFALLIKAHHCALDGHSAAELTMGLHDLSADGAQRVPVKPVPYRPEETPGMARLMLKGALNNLRSPFRIARQASDMVPLVGKTLARYFAAAARTPEAHDVSCFNHKVSAHRVFDARSFSLADIKRIRTTVPGATINDTVLSIAAGAVRHYLDDKKELTHAPLRVGAPINTRVSSEHGEGGNNISGFFCDAHVNVAEPLERLAKIRATTRNAKELEIAVRARDLTDVTKHSPAAVNLLAMKAMSALQFGARAGAPFANYLLSNVPGPTVPLYLCGSELQFWNVIAPLPSSIGLMFGATSYRDRLFLAPTACRTMMPDPEFFGACIDRSFEEHLKAADLRLSEQPELVQLAEQPRAGRRAHPGLASMANLSKGSRKKA